MQEHVSGMVVLQLFNREERAFNKFSDVNAVHMEAFKDAIMAHAVYYPVVEILSSIAIACVIWFGGNDIIRGLTVSSVTADFSRQHLLSFHVVRTVVSIGVLTAFIQYAQRFFRPIQDFSEKYNILQSAMAASERVFKLLDTPVEITSPAVTKTAGGPGRIEFDHVWFAYRTVPVEAGDSTKTAGNGHVGTGLRPVQAERSSAVQSLDRTRLDSPRRVFRHRTGRDRRHRRPHRRRQDHDHLPAAALLRRAERRSPDRRRRREGDGPSRTPPPLWRGVAGSVPVYRDGRGQHPPGHGAGLPTRTSKKPPKT